MSKTLWMAVVSGVLCGTGLFGCGELKPTSWAPQSPEGVKAWMQAQLQSEPLTSPPFDGESVEVKFEVKSEVVGEPVLKSGRLRTPEYVPEAFRFSASNDPFQSQKSSPPAGPAWASDVPSGPPSPSFTDQPPQLTLKGLWQDAEGRAALIQVNQQLGAWRTGAWVTPDWRLEHIGEQTVQLSHRLKSRTPQGVWVWVWQQKSLNLSLAASTDVAP
jgi:hypothetical protein